MLGTLEPSIEIIHTDHIFHQLSWTWVVDIVVFVREVARMVIALVVSVVLVLVAIPSWVLLERRLTTSSCSFLSTVLFFDLT